MTRDERTERERRAALSLLDKSSIIEDKTGYHVLFNRYPGGDVAAYAYEDDNMSTSGSIMVFLFSADGDIEESYERCLADIHRFAEEHEDELLYVPYE